jgi:hypothetical protein
MVEVKLNQRNPDRNQIVSNDLSQSLTRKEQAIIMKSPRGMSKVKGGHPKDGEPNVEFHS